MLKHIGAWLLVVVSVMAISLGLGAYKYQEIKAAEAAATSSPEPVEAVVAVRAHRGQWSATARAIGTVVAMRQIEIRNELAGTIAEMGFTSGSIVEAGQTLIQFDVRQERASLAAAQAEALLAKQNLDRREGLQGSPAFSALEIDKPRAEFNAATARARSLEVAIEKKRITAPFKSRIGIMNLQPGAYLDVATLIGRLQGIDVDAYVDFALPQDNAVAIHTGTNVAIAGPGVPGGTAVAKIVAEDDSIDSSNRSVRFRAQVAGLGGTLRPGTFVDVTAVTSQPRETVMVPLTAVRRSPTGEHVFVIVDEQGKLRARQRGVQTGPVQNDDIAIEKGLTVGEAIAASGSFKLRDGLLVQTDLSAAPSNDARVN